MKKLIQTKLHDPPEVIGNCFATVIACFLDSEIKDIPAVEDEMFNENSTWVKTMSKFLSQKRWLWGSLDGHLYTDEYYIVVGKSERGVNHCCIYQNGKLFHDPHPNQTGLITEDHFEFLKQF